MSILEALRPGVRSVARVLTSLLVGMACFGGYFDTPLHGAGRSHPGRCLVVSAPMHIEPHSFEVIAPAEFHVPANRQVVRNDLELRNTSRCPLRLGILCCDQWW